MTGLRNFYVNRISEKGAMLQYFNLEITLGETRIQFLEKIVQNCIGEVTTKVSYLLRCTKTFEGYATQRTIKKLWRKIKAYKKPVIFQNFEFFVQFNQLA